MFKVSLDGSRRDGLDERNGLEWIELDCLISLCSCDLLLLGWGSAAAMWQVISN